MYKLQYKVEKKAYVIEKDELVMRKILKMIKNVAHTKNNPPLKKYSTKTILRILINKTDMASRLHDK